MMLEHADHNQLDRDQLAVTCKYGLTVNEVSAAILTVMGGRTSADIAVTALRAEIARKLQHDLRPSK